MAEWVSPAELENLLHTFYFGNVTQEVRSAAGQRLRVLLTTSLNLGDVLAEFLAALVVRNDQAAWAPMMQSATHVLRSCVDEHWGTGTCCSDKPKITRTLLDVLGKVADPKCRGALEKCLASICREETPAVDAWQQVIAECSVSLLTCLAEESKKNANLWLAVCARVQNLTAVIAETGDMGTLHCLHVIVASKPRGIKWAGFPCGGVSDACLQLLSDLTYNVENTTTEAMDKLYSIAGRVCHPPNDVPLLKLALTSLSQWSEAYTSINNGKVEERTKISQSGDVVALKWLVNTVLEVVHDLVTRPNSYYAPPKQGVDSDDDDGSSEEENPAVPGPLQVCLQDVGPMCSMMITYAQSPLLSEPEDIEAELLTELQDQDTTVEGCGSGEPRDVAAAIVQQLVNANKRLYIDMCRVMMESLPAAWEAGCWGEVECWGFIVSAVARECSSNDVCVVDGLASNNVDPKQAVIGPLLQFVSVTAGECDARVLCCQRMLLLLASLIKNTSNADLLEGVFTAVLDLIAVPGVDDATRSICIYTLSQVTVCSHAAYQRVLPRFTATTVTQLVHATSTSSLGTFASLHLMIVLVELCPASVDPALLLRLVPAWLPYCEELGSFARLLEQFIKRMVEYHIAPEWCGPVQDILRGIAERAKAQNSTLLQGTIASYDLLARSKCQCPNLLAESFLPAFFGLCSQSIHDSSLLRASCACLASWSLLCPESLAHQLVACADALIKHAFDLKDAITTGQAGLSASVVYHRLWQPPDPQAAMRTAVQMAHRFVVAATDFKDWTFHGLLASPVAATVKACRLSDDVIGELFSAPKEAPSPTGSPVKPGSSSFNTKFSADFLSLWCIVIPHSDRLTQHRTFQLLGHLLDRSPQAFTAVLPRYRRVFSPYKKRLEVEGRWPLYVAVCATSLIMLYPQQMKSQGYGHQSFLSDSFFDPLRTEAQASQLFILVEGVLRRILVLVSDPQQQQQLVQVVSAHCNVDGAVVSELLGHVASSPPQSPSAGPSQPGM